MSRATSFFCPKYNWLKCIDNGLFFRYTLIMVRDIHKQAAQYKAVGPQGQREEIVAQDIEDRKVGCGSCKHVATHEKCGIPGKEGYCLGNMNEIGTSGQYKYKNYEAEAFVGEAMNRLHALEDSGERNIVIGGTGEAEVNTKWTFEEAVKSLCNVAEQCGYLVRVEGVESHFQREIHCHVDMGHFVLVYLDMSHTGECFKLDRIECRSIKVVRSFR